MAKKEKDNQMMDQFESDFDGSYESENEIEEEEAPEEVTETTSEAMEEIEASLRLPSVDDFDEDMDSGGWLMTFGDMMTLLLCFFVLMFSMSETKMDVFYELVESLRVAIGKQDVPEAGTREGLENIDIDNAEDPMSMDELGSMVKKELTDIQKDINHFITENELGGMINTAVDDRGVVITIADRLLFPPGDAEFTSGGKDLVKQVGLILRKFQYPAKVEGHTDSVPINNQRFRSNWELSTYRATETVRFLIGEGIDPMRLSAEGFGKYRPIAENDTPQGRAKNRRVEIVYDRNAILDDILEKEGQMEYMKIDELMKEAGI